MATIPASSEPSTAPGSSAASLWPSRACAFRLASHEVHCWCAHLDVPPQTSARLYATLAEDERRRGARFRIPRDQQHFIVAHGVLRDLLGRYLQTEPDQIRYVHNAFGKPALGPEFGDRVRFNLSHSAGLALIAVAAGSNVGVDLEAVRAHPDHAEIARQFFSAAEAEELSRVPRHLYAEAFIRCWTKKEALLKAVGSGLSIALDSVVVPMNTGPANALVELRASSDIAPGTRWSIWTLRPARGYIGALVVEGTGSRLRCKRWGVPYG